MLNITVGSTGLPIPLSDVKSHLNIEFDNDDDRLINTIKSAAYFIEEECGWSLTEQTFTKTLPSFPYCHLYLPKSPLLSVESVEYYDIANAQQTLSSSAYHVVKPRRVHGYLQPVDVWPDTYDRPDAVVVTFKAGGCPENAKHLLRILVANWNENREELKADIGIERLLGQLRAGGYR